MKETRRIVGDDEFDGFELSAMWLDKKRRLHLKSTAGRHLRVEPADPEGWMGVAITERK